MERLQNPALQKKEKAEFVKFKVEEQHEFPPYFKQMEKYNLEGPALLQGLPFPRLLSPVEFRAEIEKGAVVVDARMPHSFGGAHIGSSFSIWLESLPSFAGWVLPYDKTILLVLEEEDKLETAVRYLVRLGYDNIKGFLNGGIAAWYVEAFPIDGFNLISVHDLKAKLEKDKELVILDVRGQDEWDAGHIEGARHIYVGHLEESLDEVPEGCQVVVYCGTARRSNIAASILKKHGYAKVYNVLGSMAAWRKAGYEVVK